MEQNNVYTANVTLKYTKVTLSIEEILNGRCIKCDAREYCGSKFPCPCDNNEHLEYAGRTVNDINEYKEAIENFLGVLDTPIGRRQHNEMVKEMCQIGRNLIRK